jgi:hypothetical protein
MNVIKIKGQEVKIPHFYDAAKIQALFDSFCEPETKKDKVFNLIALADFLKLDSQADTLRDLLSLINAIESREGMASLSDDLYPICKRLQHSVFGAFKQQAGDGLSSYFYIYAGL